MPPKSYRPLPSGRSLAVTRFYPHRGRAAPRQFLRNGDARYRLYGLEREAEGLCAPMQIVYDAGPIAGLVERRARVDVVHAVTHGVVEQDSDLACGGGDRLGLADARREPPVESAQRRVSPSDGYGGKPQERRGPAPRTASARREHLAAGDLVTRRQA